MVVTARQAGCGAGIVDEYGDRAAAVPLDVTDTEEIAAAVAAADDAFGGIDVLVNNAGHGYLSAVEEGEDAEVRKLFDAILALSNMIKAVLPAMRARGSGHIINISSMTGLVANPPNAYYSSTKFALEAVTEALGNRGTATGHQGDRHPAGRVPHRLGDALDERALVPPTTPTWRRQAPDRAVRRSLPGDSRKGRRSGADGDQVDDPPRRLLLGGDVLKAMRDKMPVTTLVDRRVGVRQPGCGFPALSRLLPASQSAKRIPACR